MAAAAGSSSKLEKKECIGSTRDMWETLFPGGSGRSSVGMGRPLALVAAVLQAPLCREASEHPLVADGRRGRRQQAVGPPTDRSYSASSISECAAASSSV